MRLVTQADRHLTQSELDLAGFLRAQARLRAFPFWIGRVLFGGFFVYNALNHFLNLEAMAAYAAAKGVPSPEAAVALSGLPLMVGGLSIISGQWPKIGGLLPALFLIVVTPTMHAFWAEQGPARMIELGHFAKNLALLGAAFLAMAIPEPWNAPPAEAPPHPVR